MLISTGAAASLFDDVGVVGAGRVDPAETDAGGIAGVVEAADADQVAGVEVDGLRGGALPEQRLVGIERPAAAEKILQEATHVGGGGVEAGAAAGVGGVGAGALRFGAEQEARALLRSWDKGGVGEAERAERVNGAPVKIVLVGDSTVATGGGWGPGFCATMTPNVTCVDLALNGRSSKSFIDEGAWTKALAEKGDYYLVQFGHNDQKSDAARHTDAEGSFKEYLQRYVSDVDAQGAVLVLVTSLSRRTFKDGRVVEDLKDYAQASREVGIKDSITVIDLNSISTSMLNRMGQEEADKFNAVGRENEREAAGKSAIDRTHLNPDGQKMFGRIVAEQLARTLVGLGPDLIGQPMKTAQ